MNTLDLQRQKVWIVCCFTCLLCASQTKNLKYLIPIILSTEQWEYSPHVTLFEKWDPLTPPLSCYKNIAETWTIFYHADDTICITALFKRRTLKCWWRTQRRGQPKCIFANSITVGLPSILFIICHFYLLLSLQYPYSLYLSRSNFFSQDPTKAGVGLSVVLLLVRKMSSCVSL